VGALAPLAAELASRLPGRVEADAPFGARTTWRVGGNAAVLVRVEDVADLAVLAPALPGSVPRVVLGRGSNVLVADRGFAGVVVVLGAAFEAITVGDDTVTAGGATALPVLARRCAAAGRSGLGFYVGIPGSVGGAVRMNAGGHGRETVEVLVDATVVDLTGTGAPVVRPLPSLGLGYRHSALTDDGLPPGEGAFLACTFWLIDNYLLQRRHAEARTLFDRLLGIRNDVGLLAEEYHPTLGRHVGNFPQAFSHVALVSTALNMQRSERRAAPRRSD